MKNLEKTKKNHERLASALRENLQKRKSRSRFLAENQPSAAPEADEKTVHSIESTEVSEK